MQSPSESTSHPDPPARPVSQDQRRRRILRTAAGLLPIAVAVGLLIFASTRDGAPEAKFETPGRDFWTFARHMPHRRSYTASAELGGRVYVAGGMVGETGRPLDLLERFDPKRNEWTSLTPLPEPFSAAAAASLNGRMWVVGGNARTAGARQAGAPPDRYTATGRQAYSYDVRRDRWRAEPPLPVPRINHALVALGGKLYATGGLDPFEPTRTVFVYDPRTRRWSQAAPLPKGLHAHAAVVFRGEIWVIGGRLRSGTVLRDVWIYNAARNRWRPGPPLPAPLETLGADATDDRIDAVLHKTYFIYDGRRGRWRRGPGQNVSRHALAAFAIDGTLYTVGGCIYPRLADTSTVEKIELRPLS